MFVRQKAYDNCIQKVRIEFGELLGCKEDKEAYIVLKELPTLETMRLNEAHEKGQSELLEFFLGVLPKIIVEHNLYETEEKKMTNEAVVDLIFEKLEVTTKVITEYTEAIFTSRLNKKEEK